jgi:hypothetical protein
LGSIGRHVALSRLCGPCALWGRLGALSFLCSFNAVTTDRNGDRRPQRVYRSLRNRRHLSDLAATGLVQLFGEARLIEPCQDAGALLALPLASDHLQVAAQRVDYPRGQR